MARDAILKTLSGVRSRLWRMQAVRGAVWGLAVAAAIGAVLGIARLGFGLGISGWSAALLLVGPLVGALVGLFRRPRWDSAAAAVDSHYRLKDRTTTALTFLHRPAVGEWESLQIDDAATHLAEVKAEHVVPFRWPRLLSYGLVAVALAAALLVWPLTSPPVQAAPIGPNEGLIALADDLEKDLDELERAAEERQDEEIIKLVEQLREQTEALQKEGVELTEALATLSKMQAALRQHAQYNEALVSAQLNNLAGAMATAEALQPTAGQLKEGDYKAAAEELEKLEKLEPGRRGERAAAERMKKLAQKLSGKGLRTLGESVSEMAEGLSGGDSSKFRKGSKSLASQLRKHASRKKMNFLLKRQLDKLNECKGQCSMCFSQCKFCKSGNCQGQCQGKKNSLAEGIKRKKSTKPSQNFGKSTSGNLFGEKTDPNSSGKQEQLTGQAGEGPSETETITSPEGRERASRSYKERYEKYRKLSEEVLDGEPIPLGHRKMIREYFELIRPTGGESENPEA